MSEYWSIILITSLILGVIPAKIAETKGREFSEWYVYGVFLFFFAMIHAIVLPEKNQIREIKEKIIPVTVTKLKEVDFIDIECPVDIVGYEISEYKKGITYCNIDFINLSHKIILSVKLDIACYDSFGEKLGENNKVQTVVQDIYSRYKEHFKGEIPLPRHSTTRKVDIVINKILFEDNTIWEKVQNQLSKNELNKPSDDIELLNLKNVAGTDAICYPIKQEKTWTCICGCTSHYTTDKDNCRRCNRNIKFVFSKYRDKEIIDKEIEQIKENELESKRELKKQNKKIIKMVAIGVGIVLLTWLSCHLYKMYSYRLIGKELTQYNEFIKQYNEKTTLIYNESHKAEEAKDEETTKMHNARIMTDIKRVNKLKPPKKYEKVFEKLKERQYEKWTNKIIWEEHIYFDDKYVYGETREEVLEMLKNNFEEAQKEVEELEDKIRNKYYIPY